MIKQYEYVIDPIIKDFTIKRAIKYISPKEIVRATRSGKNPRKGENIEIILTLGKPNYLEREFIKLCQKAKEPFPVKKVQLKLFSNK